jgi:hypothetical protein
MGLLGPPRLPIAAEIQYPIHSLLHARLREREGKFQPPVFPLGFWPPADQ